MTVAFKKTKIVGFFLLVSYCVWLLWRRQGSPRVGLSRGSQGIWDCGGLPRFLPIESPAMKQPRVPWGAGQVEGREKMKPRRFPCYDLFFPLTEAECSLLFEGSNLDWYQGMNKQEAVMKSHLERMQIGYASDGVAVSHIRAETGSPSEAWVRPSPPFTH